MDECKDILKAIIDSVNSGEPLTFDEDMGDNTITIATRKAHTHCGNPEATFDELIDSMHDLLVKGKGLSWE